MTLALITFWCRPELFGNLLGKDRNRSCRWPRPGLARRFFRSAGLAIVFDRRRPCVDAIRQVVNQCAQEPAFLGQSAALGDPLFEFVVRLAQRFLRLFPPVMSGRCHQANGLPSDRARQLAGQQPAFPALFVQKIPPVDDARPESPSGRQPRIFRQVLRKEIEIALADGLASSASRTFRSAGLAMIFRPQRPCIDAVRQVVNQCAQSWRSWDSSAVRSATAFRVRCAPGASLLRLLARGDVRPIPISPTICPF